MKRSILVGLTLAFSLVGCGDHEQIPPTPFSGTPAVSSWDEVFGSAQQMVLEIPWEREIVVKDVLLDSRANLFLNDYRNDRIVMLDPSGQLIRQIAPPGGFSRLRTIALDANDNLMAFDTDGKVVTSFAAPDYQTASSYSVESVVAEFFPAGSDGDIIAFCPTDSSYLSRFDSTGRLIESTFRPRDEDIGTFLKRVQSGGLAGGSGSEGFYFIYPEEFAIYHYDAHLNLQRVLKSEPSEWRPALKDFPDDLSPFDYKPAHKDWWDSHSAHVGDLFMPREDVLAVTLSKGSGLSSENWFLNLYSREGLVLAEGLPVPHGGRIVGASGGWVFVATAPYLADDGSLRPASLWRHPLRLDPMNRGQAAASLPQPPR
ncbi:MAG TPA: hypothetical protein VLU25_16970 [Acidobacteriota bacterium]|nr:hypothetical protein [Acidobacteriota bacterium]